MWRLLDERHERDEFERSGAPRQYQSMEHHTAYSEGETKETDRAVRVDDVKRARRGTSTGSAWEGGDELQQDMTPNRKHQVTFGAHVPQSRAAKTLGA